MIAHHRDRSVGGGEALVLFAVCTLCDYRVCSVAWVGGCPAGVWRAYIF